MDPSTLLHAASLSTSCLTSGAPPTASTAPTELSDAELLSATRGLVGRSNQLLASLLAHLGEVEARGIHRTRACASLYAYCIYELRFSEDEAFRRVTAARLVRRFPALLDAIASGELHLTGLLMLGPLLTADNLVEVLARAKHRTKKELARLVRILDPLPQVPPRIEPLGPASWRPVPAAATWGQFMGALNPVRELEPGARPRDWTESAACDWMERAEGAPIANDGSSAARLEQDASATPIVSALARSDADATPTVSALARPDADATPTVSAPARSDADAMPSEPEPASPSRLEPQRYKVQFEASEEYVELVEKAKALLSQTAPRVDLGELHLRAMRALVTELERKKYAATDRPRQRVAPTAATQSATPSVAEPTPHGQLAGGDAAQSRNAPEPRSQLEHGPECPRQRGRQVPAALRRSVFERDEGRCTFRSDSGERCRETAHLELHHLVPFARGGEHRLDNLTLRCRAHNALAAEQDFGRHFVSLARDSNRHETWAAHQAVPCATPLALLSEILVRADRDHPERAEANTLPARPAPADSIAERPRDASGITSERAWKANGPNQAQTKDFLTGVESPSKPVPSSG
jgi:5-methylcytosine-specific restriction endonuclease McrA